MARIPSLSPVIRKVMLCLLPFIAVSCAWIESLFDRQIALTLMDFPAEHDEYAVTVEVYDKDGDLSRVDRLGAYPWDGTYEGDLLVPNGTKMIAFLLWADESGTPTYIWVADMDDVEKRYTVRFWKDYTSYLNGTGSYGVSEAHRRVVSDGEEVSLTFGTAPFIYLALPGCAHRSVRLALEQTQSSCSISYGFSLQDLETINLDPVYGLNVDCGEEDTLLLVFRWDGYSTSFGTLSADISDYRYIEYEATVAAMTPGEAPEIVYALGTSPQSILRMNLDSLDLSVVPVLGLVPRVIGFSAPDAALYVTGEGSKVIRYSVPGLEATQLCSFPESRIALDIALAPAARRLYLLYQGDPSNLLAIVDLNDGNLLLDGAAVTGNRVVAAPESGLLYSGYVDDEFLRTRITAYSTAGDSVAMVSSNASPGMYPSDIALSPDGSLLALSCYPPDSADFGVRFFDTDDISSPYYSAPTVYFQDTLLFVPGGTALYAFDWKTARYSGSSCNGWKLSLDPGDFGTVTARVNMPPLVMGATYGTLTSDGSRIVVHEKRDYSDDRFYVFDAP